MAFLCLPTPLLFQQDVFFPLRSPDQGRAESLSSLNCYTESPVTPLSELEPLSRKVQKRYGLTNDNRETEKESMGKFVVVVVVVLRI